MMGLLSDKRRRPVLLAGSALMVAASIGGAVANAAQPIAARFLQVLGGASGMVTTCASSAISTRASVSAR